MDKVINQSQLNYIQESLKDPASLNLLKVICEYTELVNAFGYPAKAVSDLSIRHLENLSLEKKIHHTEQLLELISISEPCLYKENSDNLLLQKSLNFHKLSADRKLLDTIDDETLVEAYNADMRQTFRSLNFFEMTNYSILDLITFEWYVLWKKPSLVNKKYAEAYEELMAHKLPILPIDIKPYLNLEVMDTGSTEPFEPRAVIQTAKYMGYLEKKSFCREEYFMSTCKAKLITTDLHEINRTALI